MNGSDVEPRAPAPPGHREVGGGRGYTLHAFASPGVGSVNNYWIEAAHAVVVFDGQRQISQARLALAAIERLGKPIRAIFVSHEHPDHVGGLEVFAAAAGPDAPIHGSAETRASIAADEFGYFKLAAGILKGDFAARPLAPTVEILHGQTLTIDGVDLQVHEFGPGEAASMTGLKLGSGEMLVADSLVDRMTPFMIEGRVLAWIGTVASFRSALPEVARVYPGHGDASAADGLVEAQSAYLTGFRDLVRDAMSGRNGPDAAARARVVAEVERRYPGYLPVSDVPGLLAVSVDAVARELVARDKAVAQ